MMKKIKHFFESPAKAIVSIICIIPLLAIFIAGIAFIISMIAKNTCIRSEEAQNYAFADAGIQPSAAQAVYTEFEFEDGHFVYEVSFFANNTEYEYVIKASDGTILERDFDIMPSMQTTDTTADLITTDQLTPDSAQAIALADAGLSNSDVTFTKTMLESDNGISVYEVEFFTESTEYEYKVHAETGSILGRETDAHRDTTSSPTSTIPDTTSSTASYIDAEEAKTIAVNHAGLSSSDVVFVKITFEQEGLYPVYEVEFRKGTTEYDYEIHAETGEVLKYGAELAD